VTRFTTWSLTVLFSAALLAIAPSALAVDGTVLINQNTSVNGLPGCPNAGFPIIICQSGSYKLSGNLTVNTTLLGNYFQVWDIAIAIASSNVTLDLNGFSITVNNSDPNIGHNFYAIKETSNLWDIAIRNGGITINTPVLSGGREFVGIDLSSSTSSAIEDLSVVSPPYNGGAMRLGPWSIVRHNRIRGPAGGPGSGADVTCPSVIVENLGVNFRASPCVYFNNI
jgi:hypothetical protein